MRSRSTRKTKRQTSSIGWVSSSVITSSIWLRNAVEDKVLDELKDVRGRILRTSLSKEAEERLTRVLSGPTATVDNPAPTMAQ
ncbi:DUF1269 domain-containing protein [Fibrisoma montanum]|uniref:DUF1269 domain-containing protein n=1 Tax=Fibrisoma montanum TaxID=2305895 RepID=A0A418ME40_9BACT|nr:DUF1269 domain-containing protein [Fibrisoma montanum]